MKGGRVAPPSYEHLACSSRDIRDIVSAYTVWFTLDIPHPYTPCGRGLYRQGLTRLSWGLPLRFCLASLIYILIISQGWGFVKREIQISLNFFFVRCLNTLNWQAPPALARSSALLTPLLYHKSCDLSRVFLIFFGGGQKSFRPQ